MPTDERTGMVAKIKGLMDDMQAFIEMSETEQAACIMEDHDMLEEAAKLRKITEQCQCGSCRKRVDNTATPAREAYILMNDKGSSFSSPQPTGQIVTTVEEAQRWVAQEWGRTYTRAVLVDSLEEEIDG